METSQHSFSRGRKREADLSPFLRLPLRSDLQQLSSSSTPSLSSLWCNPAAVDTLGSNLELLLSSTERRRLKRYIVNHDRELEEEDDSRSTTTSFNSFHEDSIDSVMDLDLLNPSWSQRRSYKAMLVGSSHPSFLVLHLFPTRRIPFPSAASEGRGSFPKESKVKRSTLNAEWIGMDNSVESEVEEEMEERAGGKTQTMREKLDATDWPKTALGPVSTNVHLRFDPSLISCILLSRKARILVACSFDSRRNCSQNGPAFSSLWVLSLVAPRHSNDILTSAHPYFERRKGGELALSLTGS